MRHFAKPRHHHHLPAWLPQLELRHLRVGGASLTLRMWRTSGGETKYRIEDLDGRLHVVRQPSPWSLTASLKQRAVDVARGVLRGRRRHASRAVVPRRRSAAASAD